MRFLSSVPRRWLVAGGIVTGAVVLVAVALGIVYPRIGARMIRDKVGAKLEAKLGRDITFGDIDVSLGHAVLRDVEVRGSLDGDAPLVHIDRVDVDFDTWASLVGKVKVGETRLDGVTVSVRRDSYGRDNVRDIVDRLEADKAKHANRGDGGLGRMRPTKITVLRARMLADDAMTGTTAVVSDGDATWTPAGIVAHAREVSATTPGAPKASAEAIEVRKTSGASPSVKIEGGELALWPQLALSGIGGYIVEDQDRKGHFILDLAGGYGGVPGRLWTASGEFDPRAGEASIDLVAAKFQLERLSPILEKSPVVDYKSTSIDAKLHVDIDPNGAKFAGDLTLTGLNVGHPMIADKEVHDLDLSAKIAGSYDRASRTVQLTRGNFVARDLPFSLTGTIVSPRRDLVLPEVPQGPVAIDDKDPPLKIEPQAKAKPMRGPYGIQILKLHLAIPTIACQKVVDAMPAEMAPHLQGYKLKGMFDADIKLEIDWMNLDAVVFGGHVGHNRCKVLEEPEDGPKRLEKDFEHYVEYQQGEWVSFVVGPDNPDFVPIEEINPNLIKSIMTTEDAGFYRHKGFIPSEFRTALISDLKARAFRHGASSITMQMVKNVLLYREKTLARKLQELFLTWHVEQVLTKDRILEIYFNVIEYGPALYGIGPAMKHYFGKHPRDLNLREAAFFSSILPNPKDRYKQYCQGTLTKWTTAKIERILALMFKRGRITQEEYYTAMSTPLVFMKDGTETEKECLERAKKAIKNARPTNPLKK
jgi:hypothetical protein